MLKGWLGEEAGDFSILEDPVLQASGCQRCVCVILQLLKFPETDTHNLDGPDDTRSGNVFRNLVVKGVYVSHSNCSSCKQWMFTTDHTENIKDVIRKIIEAICVEEWLDDEDGFKLLHGIFILYHKDGRFSYAH